ncbi:4573_t:CDS:2, partial [Gigaspora margarita]
NKSNKTIFDNIFAETHSKLESLNNKIFKLQDIYLTNNNLDKEPDNNNIKFINNEMYNETSSESCLLSVNSQVALKRFQEMKELTQNEVSLYFLKIIDTSMHTTEFKNGMPKAYLTINYKFKRVSICQKAWYTIYDIQKGNGKLYMIIIKILALNQKFM